MNSRAFVNAPEVSSPHGPRKGERTLGRPAGGACPTPPPNHADQRWLAPRQSGTPSSSVLVFHASTGRAARRLMSQLRRIELVSAAEPRHRHGSNVPSPTNAAGAAHLPGIRPHPHCSEALRQGTRIVAVFGSRDMQSARLARDGDGTVIVFRCASADLLPVRLSIGATDSPRAAQECIRSYPQVRVRPSASIELIGVRIERPWVVALRNVCCAIRMVGGPRARHLPLTNSSLAWPRAGNDDDANIMRNTHAPRRGKRGGQQVSLCPRPCRQRTASVNRTVPPECDSPDWARLGPSRRPRASQASRPFERDEDTSWDSLQLTYSFVPLCLSLLAVAATHNAAPSRVLVSLLSLGRVMVSMLCLNMTLLCLAPKRTETRASRVPNTAESSKVALISSSMRV